MFLSADKDEVHNSFYIMTTKEFGNQFFKIPARCSKSAYVKCMTIAQWLPKALNSLLTFEFAIKVRSH